MRLSIIRKALSAGVVLLVTMAVIGLCIRLDVSPLYWQHTLHQARYELLAWRLTLYACVALLWFSLKRRHSSGSQTALPLKKNLLWSIPLLAIGEISNFMQWGSGQ